MGRALTGEADNFRPGKNTWVTAKWTGIRLLINNRLNGKFDAKVTVVWLRHFVFALLSPNTPISDETRDINTHLQLTVLAQIGDQMKWRLSIGNQVQWLFDFRHQLVGLEALGTQSMNFESIEHRDFNRPQIYQVYIGFDVFSCCHDEVKSFSLTNFFLVSLSPLSSTFLHLVVELQSCPLR